LKPNSDKEALKTEDSEAKREVERAKLEAQTAKASEALAQRKLADAEAALRRAKEEAGRATTEAEQAKAEAQGARDSEAAVKHKLADAEAAKARAEQACHIGDTTRPGLGGRLRKWLGRRCLASPMRPRRQYQRALTLWPALCQRRHREPASLLDTDEASVSPATTVSNRSYFPSYVADESRMTSAKSGKGDKQDTFVPAMLHYPQK